MNDSDGHGFMVATGRRVSASIMDEKGPCHRRLSDRVPPRWRAPSRSTTGRGCFANRAAVVSTRLEGIREVIDVGHDVLTRHLGALVRRHRIEFSAVITFGA
jgi:hypothetical protein